MKLLYFQEKNAVKHQQFVKDSYFASMFVVPQLFSNDHRNSLQSLICLEKQMVL